MEQWDFTMAVVATRGAFGKLWRTPSSRSKRQSDDDSASWISGDDLDSAFCSSLVRRGSVRSCVSYTLEPTGARPTTPVAQVTAKAETNRTTLPRNKDRAKKAPKNKRCEKDSENTALKCRPNGTSSKPAEMNNRGGSSPLYQTAPFSQDFEKESAKKSVASKPKLSSKPSASFNPRRRHSTSTSTPEKIEKYKTFTLPRRANTFAARDADHSTTELSIVNDTSSKDKSNGTTGKSGSSSSFFRRFSFRIKSSSRRSKAAGQSGSTNFNSRASSDAEDALEASGIDIEYGLIRPQTSRSTCEAGKAEDKLLDEGQQDVSSHCGDQARPKASMQGEWPSMFLF